MMFGEITMTKRLKTLFLTTAAVAGLAVLPAMHAQLAPVTSQGHAQDELGQPVKDGEVRLTENNADPTKAKALYTFKTDENGDFKGTGISPGNYTVSLFRNNILVDYQSNQDLKPGQAVTENFDMSRPEYIAKETPERRKAIEELKAKNAAAMAANKDIKSLNATILAVRADLKTASPNYDKDIADAKNATTLRPTEPLLWVLYGDALSAKADHDAAADRANKTNPLTDDNVKQEYADAITQYRKAAELEEANPKKDPGVIATIYNQLGNAQAHSGAGTDAVASFDKAAAAQPQNAGMFYTNEAAVLFNAHQDEAALAAADKAIAADPSKPLPYYIKGQELLAKATVDKAGKIVPAPGCVEAYDKYLELDPDGPQAPSVRETLAALGQKVETHYAAKKGH